MQPVVPKVKVRCKSHVAGWLNIAAACRSDLSEWLAVGRTSLYSRER